MTRRTPTGSPELPSRSGRPPRLPDRMLALLGVSALLIIVLGMLYRSSSDEDPPETTVKMAESDLPASDAFSDLRPTSEDNLVIPALGFRWRFEPRYAASPPDSLGGGQSGNFLEDMEFVLFLADPQGRILLEELAERPDGTRILLPPEIGPGEYVWWVEVVPAQGSRLRSHRQVIMLGR